MTINRSLHRLAAKGFTLVELLIVVIIIAILAAIAIPQFADSSNDAQEAALDANLKTMRSAIEMYRVQHRSRYPSAAAADDATATAACTGASGTAGTGDINTDVAFREQLTMFSDAAGNTCSIAVPASGIIYGPYLREIPQEQISNPASREVVIVSTGTRDQEPDAATGGFQFDNRTGRLVMNSNAVGRRNTPYWQY
ncbi:prepilin-type N-terminal cleavage/methylation domain-containing protein [Massilia sp. UMI-21]|nr:prepilin-type N-terminal cleavage/methylation domain-containing protein [Massilia sp. UMI-21]